MNGCSCWKKGFNSLTAFMPFLNERLGKEWTEKERKIREWLASDKEK